MALDKVKYNQEFKITQEPLDMSPPRTVVLLIILGAICAALLSLGLNVIAAELLDWLKKHLWYTPALLGVAVGIVALAGIASAIWQFRLTSSTDERRRWSFSAAQLRRNRHQLIARGRHDWIEGVLNRSLYQIARIDLGLEDRPDVVDNTLTLVVQEAAKPRRLRPPRTPITAVFDANAGALLILGAPGSGKTTLLLELGSDLFDRAEQDRTYPIPVVFHLASWPRRRLPIAAWLVEELTLFYGVSRKMANHWITADEILPLLDGMDELAEEDMHACAEALNTFRNEHGLLPIVVCSREEEYQRLPRKLRLPNAVVVQPLKRSDVQEYLARKNEALEGIQKGVEADPTLWELLDTPLMLSIALLTYQRLPERELLRGRTLDERRRSLFAMYVDAMCGRRLKASRYTLEQTMVWLRWLASMMVQHYKTDFQVSDLITYLPMWQLICLECTEVLIIGGISGLITGIVAGVPAGLIAGPIAGVVGSWFTHPLIDPISEYAAFMFRIPELILLLLYGLIGVVISGISTSLPFGLISGIAPGVVTGLLGLIWTIVRVFFEEDMPSMYHLVILAIVNVLIGLANWLIGGFVSSATSVTVTVGVISGLIIGITFLILQLSLLRPLFQRPHSFFCGCACLLAWVDGYTPFQFVRFLNYAVERLFMRKGGRGYFFVHRMLMEYFASAAELERT